MPTKGLKISILGFGNVGKIIASQLVFEGHQIDLNCVDVDQNKWGAFLDIEQASLVNKKVSMSWNNEEEFLNSDFIIHTAGGHIPPGGDRLAVARSTIDMIYRAYNGKSFSDKTKVIVVSNPVDLSAYFINKYSGISRDRIIGLGTLVDSLRMEYYIAKKCKAEPSDVKAWALGEHGKHMVPILSHTLVSGSDIRKVLSHEEINACVDDTISTPAVIRQTQTASVFLAASSAIFLMKSMLNPKDEVYPLSVYLNPENQELLEVENIYLSVPVKVSKHGINQLLDFDIEKDELDALKVSARVISRNVRLYEQIYKPD